MRGVRHALLLLLLTALTACATGLSKLSPVVLDELAPTGKLRVGLILANPVLVKKDAGTGELHGVAVDLGRAAATQLGVPFVPVGYPTVAKLVESAKSGDWDIAFLAVDPTRAADMDFTAPYMEVDNTYLVPANSPIRHIADVDQPGIRIAVPQKSAPDLYLSRTLKHAQLIRGAGGAASAFEMLSSGKADAFAENRQLLTNAAARLPGARVLEGRFSAVQHGIAIAKGRAEGAAYMRAFVEQAKVSGLVTRAIEQAKLVGVNVAPPAPGM